MSNMINWGDNEQFWRVVGCEKCAWGCSVKSQVSAKPIIVIELLRPTSNGIQIPRKHSSSLPRVDLKRAKIFLRISSLNSSTGLDGEKKEIQRKKFLILVDVAAIWKSLLYAFRYSLLFTETKRRGRCGGDENTRRYAVCYSCAFFCPIVVSSSHAL